IRLEELRTVFHDKINLVLTEIRDKLLFTSDTRAIYWLSITSNTEVLSVSLAIILHLGLNYEPLPIGIQKTFLEILDKTEFNDYFDKFTHTEQVLLLAALIRPTLISPDVAYLPVFKRLEENLANSYYKDLANMLSLFISQVQTDDYNFIFTQIFAPHSIERQKMDLKKTTEKFLQEAQSRSSSYVTATRTWQTILKQSELKDFLYLCIEGKRPLDSLEKDLKDYSTPNSLRQIIDNYTIPGLRLKSIEATALTFLKNNCLELLDLSKKWIVFHRETEDKSWEDNFIFQKVMEIIKKSEETIKSIQKSSRPEDFIMQSVLLEVVNRNFNLQSIEDISDLPSDIRIADFPILDPRQPPVSLPPKGLFFRHDWETDTCAFLIRVDNASSLSNPQKTITLESVLKAFAEPNPFSHSIFNFFEFLERYEVLIPKTFLEVYPQTQAYVPEGQTNSLAVSLEESITPFIEYISQYSQQVLEKLQNFYNSWLVDPDQNENYQKKYREICSRLTGHDEQRDLKQLVGSFADLIKLEKLLDTESLSCKTSLSLTLDALANRTELPQQLHSDLLTLIDNLEIRAAKDLITIIEDRPQNIEMPQTAFLDLQPNYRTKFFQFLEKMANETDLLPYLETPELKKADRQATKPLLSAWDSLSEIQGFDELKPEILNNFTYILKTLGYNFPKETIFTPDYTFRRGEPHYFRAFDFQCTLPSQLPLWETRSPIEHKLILGWGERVSLEELRRYFEALHQYHPKTILTLILFSRLESAARRDLESLLSFSETTPLILDRYLFIYLLHPELNRDRSKAYLTAAPIFGNFNPYSKNPTLPPPREMVVARPCANKPIWDPQNSGALIGAPLSGKTTIFSNLASDPSRNKPSEGQYIFYIRAQGDSLVELVHQKLIAAELIDPTSPLVDLKDTITDLFSPKKKKKIKRILFLIDDADDLLLFSKARKFKDFVFLNKIIYDNIRNFKIVLAFNRSLEYLLGESAKDEVFLKLKTLMGSPIHLGPLKHTEALEFLTLPLFRMGYEFETPSLALRALSHTYGIPALIHSLGFLIVQGMQEANHGDQPYIIGTDFLNKILVNEFYELSSERFNQVLEEDPRLRFIVNNFAFFYLMENKLEFYDTTFLFDQAKSDWPKGFLNISLIEFTGLLNELVSLGILIQVEDRYRFRNENFLRIVGGMEAISSYLDDRKNKDFVQIPGPVDQRHYQGVPLFPSPLTRAQEELLAHFDSSQILIILGTPALGLPFVMENLLNISSNFLKEPLEFVIQKKFEFVEVNQLNSREKIKSEKSDTYLLRTILNQPDPQYLSLIFSFYETNLDVPPLIIILDPQTLLTLKLPLPSHYTVISLLPWDILTVFNFLEKQMGDRFQTEISDAFDILDKTQGFGMLILQKILFLSNPDANLLKDINQSLADANAFYPFQDFLTQEIFHLFLDVTSLSLSEILVTLKDNIAYRTNRRNITNTHLSECLNLLISLNILQKNPNDILSLNPCVSQFLQASTSSHSSSKENPPLPLLENTQPENFDPLKNRILSKNLSFLPQLVTPIKPSPESEDF
ncbi:MAG: hypothetical protein LBF22_11085, partial [Deltaproteobacteria bacterium]|nr:hypothetical protein [Deltaproteobacteria bacterium]